MRRVDLFFGARASGKVRRATCEEMYTFFLSVKHTAASVHALTTTRPKVDKHILVCVLYELGPMSEIEHLTSKPHTPQAQRDREEYLSSITEKLAQVSRQRSIRIEDNYGAVLYTWKNPVRQPWFDRWLSRMGW